MIVFLELISVVLGIGILHLIVKPLLMPALGFGFIKTMKQSSSPLTKLILWALFFSWLGDVFLMFERNGQHYFIFGLVSFLVAHVFYIICFKKIFSTERMSFNIKYLIGVSLFLIALMFFLNPHLKEFAWPVRIYGFVICSMLALALHMLNSKNSAAGRLLACGATIFVISDTCIALNKFYVPFKSAGFIIMTTYTLAQLLIVYGIVKYAKKTNSASGLL